MKRLITFIFLLCTTTFFCQLKDVKIIIPKDMGFSYGDFTQFFPDGKNFVIAGNSISVLNTETAEIVDEYDLLNTATNLSISSDGKYILATSANELLILTFKDQKLEVFLKTNTAELITGLPNSQYYGALPIGGCFFTDNSSEIYVCVGSFSLVYDILKKTAISSHAFNLGDYISVSASYHKKHEVVLSMSSGTVTSLVKQSLSDLSKITEIFKGKNLIYRMRLRDSLLFGYTAEQNFIYNLDNNKMVLEFATPKTDRKYFNGDEKLFAQMNKRTPISSFETGLFEPDEYILDIDFLPGTNLGVYATYKGTKYIDLKTKKLVRAIPGSMGLQIKASKDGNRLVSHAYYPYKAIRVYDPKDKDMKLISERQSMGNAIYFPEVSPGKRWLYTNNITSGFLWDLTNFSKYAEVKDISGSDSSSIYRAYFISDSELVVNSTRGGKNMNLSVYNINRKKHTKIIKKGVYALTSGFMNGEFYFVDYTSLHIVNLKTMAEEKYEGLFSIAVSEQYQIINYTPELVFIPEAGKFKILNRKTKKVEYQGENWGLTNRVMISPDSKYVFTTGQVTKKRNVNGNEVEIPMTSVIKIDIAQKKIVQDYAATYYLYDFKIKNGGKNIGAWYVKQNWNSAETDKEVIYSEYNLESGEELLSKTIAKTPEIFSFHFSSENGRYFGLSNSSGNFFKIYGDKGDELIDLVDMKIYLPKCFFLEGQEKMILTGNNTSLATFVDLKNKKVTGQLANAKDDQFFLVTSDLHYMGSKEFIKHIRFKYRSELFSFEQFDAYLNQPHSVLRAFGCSDSSLIHAYETAYLKRMKVLGLKPGSKINFSSLPSIQYVQMKEEKPGWAAFSISVNKGLNKLAKIDVYNNGTLVFSENIPADKSSKYDKSFSFETSSGINRFEFIAKDEAGLESPHIARMFNNTNLVKANLYLVVIASEKFKEKDFNLAYAVKDASDVANTMANSKSFGKIEIKKLFNQSFAPDSVAALKSFFGKAGINDVVMVFFAGHGYLDTDFSYYFPTYYTDFSDPKINSVAYKSFETLFKDMKPTRKLMFIDACFSGEVDEDEINIDNNPDKGIKKDSSRTVKLAGTSFAQSTAMEMSKTIFSDLRQNTGATIISSAGGTEAAFEGEKWNNGLFTHCLLEGMKEMKADQNHDSKITLSELQKYVGEEVNKLSEGKQTPTYRMENTVLDYELW